MSPRMVDIGQKAKTQRFAAAEAVIQGAPEVLDALWAGQLPKGEARPAAQIAGIPAAKRTPELLPMCHPIRLDSVEVELSRPPDLSPIHEEPGRTRFGQACLAGGRRHGSILAREHKARQAHPVCPAWATSHLWTTGQPTGGCSGDAPLRATLPAHAGRGDGRAHPAYASRPLGGTGA